LQPIPSPPRTYPALQPERFGNIHEFLYKYGGLRTPEQVQQLQTDLQPIMLRRVKEDVEKSIPPKIETIVNVELTNLQVLCSVLPPCLVVCIAICTCSKP
jgi:hypothetical protein